MSKMVFLKNVTIETEKWDLGNVLGMRVSVGEGKMTLRFAVYAPLWRTVKAPVYAPDEKVYVTGKEQVPFDDGDYCPVEVDEGGVFYVKKGEMTDPGESVRVSEREVIISMLESLMERLTAVYLAGKLLEEGAQEGSVETTLVRGEDDQLHSLLEYFGVDNP